jgi:hypothetical protein
VIRGQNFFLAKLAKVFQTRRRLEPGSGQEAASRQLSFPFFRLAVARATQPGEKRNSAYESGNSVKKLQNVYCFGSGARLLWTWVSQSASG